MKRFVVLLAVLVALASCKSDASKPGPVVPASVAAVPKLEFPPVPDAGAEARWTRPFVYRIDGAKPSWLFGTIHVSDPALAKFPPSLEQALAAADVVDTEVPMDASMGREFASGAKLSGGKTLDKIVPAPLVTRAKGAFADAELVFTPFLQCKPWFLAVEISLIDHLAQLQDPIDARIYRRAQGSGKEVGGLETVKEQLDVFDGLTDTEQVGMLAETLDQRDKARKEGRDPLHELLVAYVAGDEDGLEKALDRDYDPKDPLDVKMRARLLTDRNVHMAERITDRVHRTPARSWLFAVGSAHLLGTDGVVAKLRAAGLGVVRVDPASP